MNISVKRITSFEPLINGTNIKVKFINGDDIEETLIIASKEIFTYIYNHQNDDLKIEIYDQKLKINNTTWEGIIEPRGEHFYVMFHLYLKQS